MDSDLGTAWCGTDYQRYNMNERIRELVKQAGGHFSTHTLTSNPVQYRESVGLWDNNIEKFAELIVRECEKSIKSVPTHFEAQDKIIVECLKSIRETFRS